MKKFLSILLCVALTLSLLSACGGKPDGGDATEPTAHKHTYNGEWSFDQTNHWYDANCGHSDLKANFGEHLDDDMDGICDVCDHDFVDCQHTYSETWSADAQSHWHASTCLHLGAVADQAAHTDENNDGACDVCDYTGDHVHTFEETWTCDATKHWHAATCGHAVSADAIDHVDADNDGDCDICGWFDDSHTHTYSDAFASDVTYHWHAADCEHSGAITGKEQHVDSDDDSYCDTCAYRMCKHIDYDLNGDCDICGASVDPDHVHTFGTEIASDLSSHWYVATCHPGAIVNREDHVDQNKDGVCDVCAFQICGHAYAETWTYDETHHWQAILCTCFIERKNYETHVDADSDGSCDICMYGLPVPAVYEVIVDHEPYTFKFTSMWCCSAFTVNFPQPGRYVITPDDENFEVLVSEDSESNSYYLTLDVEQAGEMTLYFRGFDFDFYEGKETTFTYTVIRMDDLVLETMQGKVELPSNTMYTIKFIAPKVGIYKMISDVDGLVIGLTEDTMEYFKGHIEMDVQYVGQEFTLYVFFESSEQLSYVFDWRLEEPFCLNVGEGNYAVDVGPTQIDYKVEFTAPADGYYLLKVHNKWLTFAQMGEIYDVPVRMETMEVLTHYMVAGEVYTIWLQTVYDYPDSTRCYDTLSITNVGEKMDVTGGTVTPGAEGSRYCFQVNQSMYYRIELTGGELGIIAFSGTVTWTTNAYEVQLAAGQTYTFMIRGEGAVTVQVTAVEYSMQLANGENTVYMEPSRFYDVSFLYNTLDKDGNPLLVDMNPNSVISLSWEGNLLVYVNGVAYISGAEIPLLDSQVQIMLRNNGGADVKIKVTVLYDANANSVEGVSKLQLFTNQLAVLAVNRDGDGAEATFTAEIGGTYTLTTYDAIAVVYIVTADGVSNPVLLGAGSYSFSLDVGETIAFYFNTSNQSTASLSVLITPGA